MQEQGLRKKREREKGGVGERKVKRERGRAVEKIRAREHFNLVWWKPVFVVHVRGGCFLPE